MDSVTSKIDYLPTLPKPLFENTVYPYENSEKKFAKYQRILLKRRNILNIICYFLVGLFGTAIVTLLIIGGAFPCLITKCHKNASVCINRPFYAQCICDYGFSGNGKTVCDVCGLTFNAPDLRIIGGKAAKPFSWPSAVFITQNYKGDFLIDGVITTLSVSFQCGGTIINRKTILTAAHCISKSFEYRLNTFAITLNSYYPTWESMFNVYVGIYSNANISSNMGFEDKFDISKIIIHESFSSETVLNDIAIFKLKKSISLSIKVQPVCLPNVTSSTYPGYDLDAFIIGWGKTNVSDSSASPILQNAAIWIYDSQICSGVFSDFKKNWESQICAGNYSGGIDTCQGDSGSGLFTNTHINETKRQLHVGVVSYGYLCGEPGYPGIYTRTSFYLNWIIQNYDF